MTHGNKSEVERLHRRVPSVYISHQSISKDVRRTVWPDLETFLGNPVRTRKVALGDSEEQILGRIGPFKGRTEGGRNLVYDDYDTSLGSNSKYVKRGTRSEGDRPLCTIRVYVPSGFHYPPITEPSSEVAIHFQLSIYGVEESGRLPFYEDLQKYLYQGQGVLTGRVFSCDVTDRRESTVWGGGYRHKQP